MKKPISSLIFVLATAAAPGPVKTGTTTTKKLDSQTYFCQQWAPKYGNRVVAKTLQSWLQTSALKGWSLHTSSANSDWTSPGCCAGNHEPRRLNLRTAREYVKSLRQKCNRNGLRESRKRRRAKQYWYKRGSQIPKLFNPLNKPPLQEKHNFCSPREVKWFCQAARSISDDVNSSHNWELIRGSIATI